MEIAILGGGSWGTALAIHLAQNNHSIKIWEFFEAQAQEMQEKRVCPLLPHVRLPENIFVSSDLSQTLPGSELVLLVVPSNKVKATLEKAKSLLEQQPIIICSKGLGENLKLLTEVAQEIVDNELFCLSGPTHAEEVGQGLLSGAILAGKDRKKLLQLKKAFSSEKFRIELSTDLIGVQIGAALKNILAVFIGVLDGSGLGDNTKAYVMTKGLAEIKKIGRKMGAKEKTFYGLAGLGDIIVTCTSQHSRNRYLGEQIGKGRKLEEVISEMKMVAEGVTTLKEAIKLKEKFALKLPLIEGLYSLLFEGKKIEEVLRKI